jgi:hypothetical protein
MYHNTTNEIGVTLNDYSIKAENQNDAVLELFQKHAKLSPSMALSKYRLGTGKNPPLTSIRRAITDLTKAGKLEMTSEKMKGSYGRDEYFWKIATD